MFRTERGVGYLAWLTELFFAFQALLDAQESGIIPWDEPLDPMSFVSNPNIPGAFPLFISMRARKDLRKYTATDASPYGSLLTLAGNDSNGSASCFAIAEVSSGQVVWSRGSIYLQGFGVTACDAAEEIAVVNLASRAKELISRREVGVQPEELRPALHAFLQSHSVGMSGQIGKINLGFSLSYRGGRGNDYWTLGPLRDMKEVRISPLRDILSGLHSESSP